MLRANTRIGPHNLDVISLFVGSLLGDANLSISNCSVKFRFRQSIIHKEYIFFLYNFLFLRGYASAVGPSLYTVTNFIEKTNEKKEYQGYAFNTFSFTSLVWLYDLFYNKEGEKYISPLIENYFTPLSLAFLIMDDGGYVKGSKSVRIHVNAFTLEEVTFLVGLLKSKFDLDCTIQKRSRPKGDLNYVYKEKYNIYFLVKSMPKLQVLVKPYIHSSMLYKIGL